jgi:hypothetical protein
LLLLFATGGKFSAGIVDTAGAIGVVDIGDKFAIGIIDVSTKLAKPVANFPPVSLILVVPLVSLTSATNLPSVSLTYQQH